jgi:NAD(P)-dependent dehydrogenase (short-subunit alcohol dehydrogenase family)
VRRATSPAQRIAVVTGGNRGIGFEICRQLAQQGLRVVLTSRGARKGKAAVKALYDAGLSVAFHTLDVTSARSIRSLADSVAKKFGRVDVLVNNAGIMIDPHGARLADSDLKTFRSTLETNTLGPLALTQALLPLMKKRNYGRIVNLSSGLGQLSEMSGGTPAYRVSKTALNAVTRITAAETRGANILVNSMCPGWVKTDMGGPNAPRTVARGAATAVWLATLPDDGPTGGFFRDRKPIPW